MPRGVYDRSKTKAQRAAEHKTETKTADAAPKRRGRKPGSKNAVTAAAAPQAAAKSSTRTTSSIDSFVEFNEIRSNLATLNSLASTFKDVPGVKEEIQANVALMAELRQRYFPVKAKSESTEEIVQNGTQQTQQYTSTVPLPPSPVQVIPPHS